MSLLAERSVTYAMRKTNELGADNKVAVFGLLTNNMREMYGCICSCKCEANSVMLLQAAGVFYGMERLKEEAGSVSYALAVHHCP